MQGGHAGHVDPVHVDVDAGPPQQRHDGVPVALLDALLEHHLVGEAHPPPPRVLPSEHAGTPRHPHAQVYTGKSSSLKDQMTVDQMTVGTRTVDCLQTV